jgi:hypothetical protein
MKKIFYHIEFVGLILISGCIEKPPTQVDGTSSLQVFALADTSTEAGIEKYVRFPSARVILTSEYGIKIVTTDSSGYVLILHLPASTYSVSVQGNYTFIDTIYQFSGNIENFLLTPTAMLAETVKAKPVLATGIVINEIYSCGAPSYLYFWDLFIELYNAGHTVKYLDGAIVMRVNSSDGSNLPGQDWQKNGSMNGVTYIYKFPGNSGDKKYAVNPGQFVVLASNAIDHSKQAPGAVDLSHSDWEFYNQYSGTSADNPGVPNLTNMKSSNTTPFLIGLTSDIVVIASGEDTIYTDGIKISTIWDGVEYRSSTTSNKTLDSRIDRGRAISPPKYSGQSLQRRGPGFDSNNSSFDFEIIPKATPGRQTF